MSTKIPQRLGSRIRHTVTLEAGESTAVTLDSSDEVLTVQVSVGAGDAASAHGSCDDAVSVTDVGAQAFPLFGETGAIPAGAARTVAVPYPGPLRTVFLNADAANTGTVRVVVLQ